MFKKKNKISFIIDKNDNFYIEVTHDKNDKQAFARMGKMAALLQAGDLRHNVSDVLFQYFKNEDPALKERVFSIIDQYIVANESKLSKKYIESKLSKNRYPIISPDLVLTTFKNSINT